MDETLIRNKSDSIVRLSLWYAWNKKCFYCGTPILEWENLRIDHVLPDDLKKKRMKKIESIKN